jgi:dihydroflavonol-4-reductase
MILVTGATGFLGSHLIRQLVLQNYEVRAIRRPSTSMLLLQDIANKIDWVAADILEIDKMNNALQGVEYVIHTAAKVSFAKKDKEVMFKINQTGTANIVNACLCNNIKKLVHVSSVAALGRNEDSGKMISETTQWEDSKMNSQYAISKMLAEREVWRGIGEGLNAVIINPTIILGSGNWEHNTPNFFRKIDKGLKYYTNGSNGFVGVNDVVSIIISLMKTNINGEQFLVSAGNYNYKQIFDCIADSINKPRPNRLASAFITEVVWRLETVRSALMGSYPLITKETARSACSAHFYDNTKIKKELNFEFTSIEKVIADIGKMYTNQM